MDIWYDLFGFLLASCDCGILSRFCSTSFMAFISLQDKVTFITTNYVYVIIGVALYSFGYVRFRITNIERHIFCDCKEKGCGPDKYKSLLNTIMFFGDCKTEFIKSKEGSLLLIEEGFPR
eukprot:TRINITY_DN76898_c0_g1_i1.p1 TRINITY_DN76898_c0_g1~~TRINITY_DN76898_c0_g1_i1.p1  ORF type:complete len:120 (-),score=30.72 TRINITY_DN76898_c0_g1_i1:136-495(-)